MSLQHSADFLRLQHNGGAPLAESTVLIDSRNPLGESLPLDVSDDFSHGLCERSGLVHFRFQSSAVRYYHAVLVVDIFKLQPQQIPTRKARQV